MSYSENDSYFCITVPIGYAKKLQLVNCKKRVEGLRRPLSRPHIVAVRSKIRVSYGTHNATNST